MCMPTYFERQTLQRLELTSLELYSDPKVSVGLKSNAFYVHVTNDGWERCDSCLLFMIASQSMGCGLSLQKLLKKRISISSFKN